MNTPTLTGAYTCTHHNDQQRTACPICLVTALTAERDRWQEIAKAASAEREHNANVAQAIAAERDQLQAQLRALTLVCGTNDANKFETWIDRANARAERAESDLAAERSRLNWLDQQGAHYGWKVQLPADYPNVKECVFVCRNTTSGHKTIREAIDAAMKEGK
jgi:hypothetical protein